MRSPVNIRIITYSPQPDAFETEGFIEVHADRTELRYVGEDHSVTVSARDGNAVITRQGSDSYTLKLSPLDSSLTTEYGEIAVFTEKLRFESIGARAKLYVKYRLGSPDGDAMTVILLTSPQYSKGDSAQ